MIILHFSVTHSFKSYSRIKELNGTFHDGLSSRCLGVTSRRTYCQLIFSAAALNSLFLNHLFYGLQRQMWVLLWPLRKVFVVCDNPMIYFFSIIWFRTNLQNTTLRNKPGASNIWGPSNTCGPTNFCAGPSNNGCLSNTHSASNTWDPINICAGLGNISFISNTRGANQHK